MRSLLLLFAALLVGCSSAPTAQSAATQAHAECLVCKHNADLACVDVAVDPKTPTCTCNGKTYYFCSEECRSSFEKNPTKYLSRH